ncbi:MAG: endopeptidase La [Mucispirillum sp.]|uniref:Lon protease n=1 Tax=Candidatus Mucispirillum faecigallinarum TaxID=2838699 RepID=A0A9D2KC24_9BACT|nr:endopeptidase La [Mucispirillum sp.]HIZ90425.1 endopeptidase La [Candidatus Mucispirillum faecigallinarum]
MSQKEQFTVIPLRDVVVFPHMITPIFVGRPRSVKALHIANTTDKRLFLSLQKDAATDNPEQHDLNETGVIARVLQTLQLPDGNVKVLIEGLYRAKMTSFKLDDECYFADVEIIDDEQADIKDMDTARFMLIRNFETYVGQTKRVNQELLHNIIQSENLTRLTFMVAANLKVKAQDFQNVLDINNPVERAEKVIELIQTELELLKIDERIKNRVKARMSQSQKEYYLNEQMKAIQKEMGKEDDAKADIDEIEQKIKEMVMPEQVKERAEKELKKLRFMPPMSAETTVVRNYLDWIISLPWNIKTEDIIDIKHAEEVLNKDHYGLEKPKERILEFLSVRKYSENMKGSIICFVGPPGVGKTSLARSIADAMGRKFVRMSMGGVRDEAEIRGHRRTYIGALPGKIVQSMKKAGSMNPVFLLDEIDKIGSDYRGDPASALLEALDPEQNNTFTDHYLETELDLSKVFFITTANSLETIPAPLLDRMEVIRLSGYTEQEKLHIARGFLIPKELKEHNVPEGKITVTDSAVMELITYYTKEAGVRSLERNIASLIRKSVKKLVTDETIEHIEVDDKLTQEYLGPRKFRIGGVYDDEEMGVATGLAWTQYGGDLLQIEVALFEGSGKLIVTGHLGDVMKESANIAYSVVKSIASDAGVPAYRFKDFDIHLHVPEGAVPKDGPSAGITMATAILSAVSERKANCKIAMTGEITLRGKVLQIGGLKEKVLAAHRAGIRTVICPIENEKDLTDIPEDVRNEMEFKLVSTFDEVRELVLK